MPGAVGTPGGLAGSLGAVLFWPSGLRHHQELAAGQLLGEPDLA
jgi:hypothetical protein